MLGFLLFLVGSSLANPVSHWQLWKAEHGKTYPAGEEFTRMSIFFENKDRIDAHNELFEAGKVSFSLKLNHFADMTEEEFREMNKRNGPPLNLGDSVYVPSTRDIPTEVDWRKSDYVTPIKNQGQCGSCWAFSTTGSMEGQMKNATGELVSLSEQQLVDCSRKFGNMGCSGGLMDNAFKYIEKFGLETEEAYPYTGRDGKCTYDEKKVHVKAADIKGFVDVHSGDEHALVNAIAEVGPISVAIDASHFSFQFYHSGVYNSWLCSSTRLDHGVLAVGYGVYDYRHIKEPYYLVKNSWGEGWGLEGYIMMSRFKNNQCGIATSASYPVLSVNSTVA